MRLPRVTLGGIPIMLHAGAPAQSYETDSAGESEVRLSGGALVTMTAFRKEVINISGAGWMGPGFDGLDFREAQELRCTQPKRQSGRTPDDLVFTLRGVPRPDVAPWAWALVDNEWIATPCTLELIETPVEPDQPAIPVQRVVTVSPVAGAALYSVQYMPTYWVKCTPPPEALDATSNSWTWQIQAREI